MARHSKAYIAGIYEHPTRKADDKTLAQLHAEVAVGALRDAGLTKQDVDGYFCDATRFWSRIKDCKVFTFFYCQGLWDLNL